MRYSFKWNKQQILMDFHIRDVDSFEKKCKRYLVNIIKKEKRLISLLNSNIDFVIVAKFTLF